MVSELENETMQRSLICEVAQNLSDISCENVQAYYVGEIYDYVDFCIIATVRSEVHKRGVVDRLAQFFSQKFLHSYAQRCSVKTKTQKSEQGWLLIDLYDIVIHLMNDDTRNFYELEKMWFNAQCIFSSEHVSTL